jgi:arginine decarboxylase-like protein
MDAIQQNLFVEIHSKDTMRSLNPSDIALNLKRQIQRGLKSENFLIDGTEIKWHSLLPFNVEKFGAFGVSLNGEPNYMVNMTEVFVNEQGEMKYRNPRVVCFYTDMKFDRFKPLVSRFKDALRQVEKYSPSATFPIYHINKYLAPSHQEFRPFCISI